MAPSEGRFAMPKRLWGCRRGTGLTRPGTFRMLYSCSHLWQ